MLLDDGVLDDAALDDLGLDPMFTGSALLDDDGVIASPQEVGTSDARELYAAQIKTEF